MTDPRMTRFTITLEQGVAFVLRCLENTYGGEIFVPKIPSMKIADLATAIAPDIPRKIVGIRPGEKLHEAMITLDDARSTKEMDDHYVILAPSPHRDISHVAAEGRPVPEGFEYKSDTNPAFMSVDEIRGLIHQMGL